mmetsp:Transcript_19105/g.34763  ORF Transcript_19105/g.34763 Transcript_19105/m.34763 type:complete len:485 (-) Transcript_19105:39-1493(-)
MLTAIKLVGLTTVITGTAVVATYPELRESTGELLRAGKRLGRITATAANIAFDYSFGVTHDTHTRNAERLKEVLRTNGGIYVKFGQCIAQLDLLVPEEYSKTMKSLFSEAQVSPFSDVKATLEEELKQPLEAVFKEFDNEPIASASLAQVHRAVLHSGKEVAVKVQHRWIRKQYPGDVKVLTALLGIGKRLFSDFDYLWLADAMKYSVQQELDFTTEAHNSRKCAAVFVGNRYVKVPSVYDNLSTDRVLTMEFIKGIKVNDIESLQKSGIHLADLSKTLSGAFNHMVFNHGLVHCDPHPGNILVRPIRSFWGIRAQVVILDHGLYRELTPEFLSSYRALWRAIFARDEENIKLYAERFGVTDLYPLLAGMLTGHSWEDLMETTTLEALYNPLGDAMMKEDLRQNVMEWRKEINDILGSVHNHFVLLFKTFEWLRAIDAELGTPVNTMNILADYCTRDTSFIDRWTLWLKLWAAGVWLRLHSIFL